MSSEFLGCQAQHLGASPELGVQLSGPEQLTITPAVADELSLGADLFRLSLQLGRDNQGELIQRKVPAEDDLCFVSKLGEDPWSMIHLGILA